MSQGFTKNVIIPLPLAVSSGGTGVTTSTGTGSVVLNNSPNIIGVTNGSNAAAGSEGEYISSVIPNASSISMTSTIAMNITSISLSAGDWDVRASVAILGGASTNFTVMVGGISNTNNSFPIQSDIYTLISNRFTGLVFSSVSQYVLVVPTARQNLSATTTIFLNASATFTVSTAQAFGWISARRIR